MLQSLLEVSSTDSGDNRTLALENTIKTVYTVSDVPPPGIEITEGLITYESIGRPIDYSQYCDIYRHKCFGKDCRIQIVRRAEIGPKTRIVSILDSFGISIYYNSNVSNDRGLTDN